MPFDSLDTAAEVTEPIMQRCSAGECPHLVEMVTEHILQPGYDFGDEFEFGLNVIIEALSTFIRDNSSEPPPDPPTASM